ncbi:hypothetical protein PENANT_c026G02797 [Penicillium antarcticum]|uniref:Uncharacterized protein n=1 Tax=Penicillium antarcticum TaxID=416450 RepID=A0A1V6PXD5_9EURO|nr:hypothetical protein PENANT_c026G02797 [Penicillium antarcticum]
MAYDEWSLNFDQVLAADGPNRPGHGIPTLKHPPHLNLDKLSFYVHASASGPNSLFRTLFNCSFSRQDTARIYKARAQENMEELNSDALSARSAQLLSRLLVIEAKAAEGDL